MRDCIVLFTGSWCSRRTYWRNFNEMGIIGFIGYFLPAIVEIILLILTKEIKTKQVLIKTKKIDGLTTVINELLNTAI